MAVTLGRYQIVRHLADGGMAEVLLARTNGIEGFSRHVVIKRIRADQVRDPSFVQMFLDEARLAASLHHHNVVQVHDIGQDRGEYFFAMEYVHGEDARALLRQVNQRRELVPLEHVITILTAAAAGLHHAHEQRGPDRRPLNIVHRDVSPANLMVGYDGGVKVTDFGIAKAAQRSTETRTGTLKGKIAYMSPEQCTGKPVDRRSDVFALGIVLYELVTARRLFKGDSDYMTMSAIVQGEIPSPRRLRPEISPRLEQIILKALAKNPEQRYATADDLRLALEAFAASAGMRTSTTALADYMKHIFGSRPEPWFVDDDDAEVLELTIDFDGSASGIVQPSESPAVLPAITADAPLARARARSTGNVPAIPRGATRTDTPVSWTVEPGAQPSTGRRRWLVGGAGALAVIVAIAMAGAFRGGSPDEPRAATGAVTGAEAAPRTAAEPPATAAAAPASPTVPAAAVEPPLPAGAAGGPAAVPADATPAAPAITPERSAPVQSPATAPRTPATRPRRDGEPRAGANPKKPATKPAKPDAKHGDWDPDALFLQ